MKSQSPHDHTMTLPKSLFGVSCSARASWAGIVQSAVRSPPGDVETWQHEEHAADALFNDIQTGM